MTEELLEQIIEKLEDIRVLETQGADGDDIFRRLDSILTELESLNSRMENIEKILDDINFDNKEMSGLTNSISIDTEKIAKNTRK